MKSKHPYLLVANSFWSLLSLNLLLKFDMTHLGRIFLLIIGGFIIPAGFSIHTSNFNSYEIDDPVKMGMLMPTTDANKSYHLLLTENDKKENSVNCPSPTNVAFQKTATQSTTNGASAAGGALDGSFVSWPPEFFARTNWTSEEPWWEVDLGDNYTITGINLFKVTGTSDGEFEDVSIYLSSTPFPPGGATGTPIEVETGAIGSPTAYDYTSAPLTGRYLRIEKNDSGMLKISEVEVFGCLAGGDTTPPEVTLSTASSTVSGPFVVDAVFTEDVSVLEASDFSMTNGTVTNVSGSGDTYTVDVTPTGANGSQTIVSLPAGSVVDNAQNSNLVSNPDLTVTYNTGGGISITDNITNESPAGAANGAVDITVTGGSGNYTYAWSNGASSQDISGLAGGSYTVTVDDGNTTATHTAVVGIDGGGGGCSNPTNIALGKTATQSTTNAPSEAEGALDGSFVSWPPEFFARTNWTSEPAWWEVDLGDEYDITSLKLYKVDGTNDGEFENVNVYLSSDPFPSGGATGTPLEVIPGAIAIPTEFDYSSAVKTGRYLRIEKQNAGMLKISEVEVFGCLADNTPDPLAISLTPTNPSSPIATDGSVLVTVTGGTPDYQYLWSVPNTGPTPELLDNAGVGTYSVTVVDDLNVSVIGQATLEFPVSPLDVTLTPTNASDINSADGFITTTVTGGWGNYSYIWNNGLTVQNPSNLSPAMYSVTVSDEIGNTVTENIVVGYGPDNISIAISNITNADCPGSPTGTVTISVTGGAPDYDYYWSNGSIVPTIIGVVDGDYTVTVIDQNNNSEMLTVTVGANNCGTGGTCTTLLNLSENTQPTQSSDKDPPFTADKAVDGNTDGDPYSGFSVAHTSWETNAWWEVELAEVSLIDNIELWGATTGNVMSNYYVFISELPFTSTDPAVLAADPNVTNILNTGFTSTPSIHNFGITGKYIRVQLATTGFVVIAEAKIMGCDPPALNPLDFTYSAVPPTGINENDGAILLNVFGGTPDYTYDWGPEGTDMNLTMVTAGTYNVTVTDQQGNTDSETIVLNAENINPAGTYHHLKKKLDGGVAYASTSWLRFIYDEKYKPFSGAKLSYNIYGPTGAIVTNGVELLNVGSNSAEHMYGENFYALQLSQISAVNINQVYTLEVSGGNKEEIYYLRFRPYCPFINCISQ